MDNIKFIPIPICQITYKNETRAQKKKNEKNAFSNVYFPRKSGHANLTFNKYLSLPKDEKNFKAQLFSFVGVLDLSLSTLYVI